MRLRAVLILLSLAGTACGTTTPPAAPTSSAVFSTIDLTVGSGATAVPGNKVTVSYSGWLYDASQPDGKGRQFDSMPAYSFTLGAGQVIKGWDQGVLGMRVGGRRRLTVPPELAYGAAGVAGAIPSNATLLFEVTLLGIG
jgi:FKBP-type peptidyl-prolyl cis-trans isomerase